MEEPKIPTSARQHSSKRSNNNNKLLSNKLRRMSRTLSRENLIKLLLSLSPQEKRMDHEHHQTIAGLCISSDMIIMLRPLGSETEPLTKENSKCKCLETKAKTSNHEPIEGDVPFIVSLSKASGNNLQKLQKENEDTITTSTLNYNRLLKTYFKIKQSNNTQEEHEAFVKKFNSAKIVKLVTKQVKLNEEKYELHYAINIDGDPARDNEGRPIFIIKKSNWFGLSTAFLKYDYDSKQYELTASCNTQPVEILTYTEIRLNETTKRIEEINGKPSECLYSITSDYDILTCAKQNNQEEKVAFDAQILFKHLMEERRTLSQEDINRVYSTCNEIQKLENRTTTYNDQEQGIVTDDESKIVEELNQVTNGAINHGPETNNPFPEEFKPDEEYLVFLPNNYELLAALEFIGKEVKTYPITTKKEGNKNNSHNHEEEKKSEESFNRTTYDSHFLILGGKGKSAEEIEQDICGFINLARHFGYPLPINPRWGWTKSFKLEENFTDEDLMEYIKSDLDAPINIPENNRDAIFMPSVYKKSWKLALKEIQDEELKDTTLNNQARNNTASDEQKSNEEDHENEGLFTKTTRRLSQFFFPDEIQITELDEEPNPQHVETKEQSSSSTFNADNNIAGDKKFWKKARKYMTHLQYEINDLVENNTNPADIEKRIRKKGILIEKEQTLLDIRLQITKLLMEPSVIYQNVLKNEQDTTQQIIGKELENRIKNIRRLCKEFSKAYQYRSEIYKSTSNSRDLVSTIINKCQTTWATKEKNKTVNSQKINEK